jgi:2-polyprenyl-3-methyl-5-hydroxy-6-metoxy-1,4-benzoquinol methylase
MQATEGFYDALAEHYHLIFDDWDQSIERQADVLNALLAAQLRAGPLKILDCACGIGTQALGFASRGHRVVASDLSSPAVARAMREAKKRELNIEFCVSNMTSLAEIEGCDFDVVAALDNALPHLSAEHVAAAARAMASKLKPDGMLLASIRDYDALINERPTMQEPAFYGLEGARRIVHQVWDWIGQDRYTVHLYITRQTNEGWQAHHFVSEYRCPLRDELSRALENAGLCEVQWLMPNESGFYQPIVLARKGERPRASR